MLQKCGVPDWRFSEGSILYRQLVCTESEHELQETKLLPECMTMLYEYQESLPFEFIIINRSIIEKIKNLLSVVILKDINKQISNTF